MSTPVSDFDAVNLSGRMPGLGRQEPVALRTLSPQSRRPICDAVILPLTVPAPGNQTTSIPNPESRRSGAHHRTEDDIQELLEPSTSMAFLTSAAIARAASQACSRSPRTVPSLSGIASS